MITNPDTQGSDSSAHGLSDTSSVGSTEDSTRDATTARLINWNYSMLLPKLKAVVARRNVAKPTRSEDLRALEEKLSRKYMVRHEVKEIIDLPSYVPGLSLIHI